MKHCLLLIAILASFLGRSAASSSGGNEQVLCFRVVSSQTLRPIAGAEVSAMAPSGSILDFGATDDHGNVCIPKVKLQPEHAVVVLFCYANHYCGAFRTTTPAGRGAVRSLLEYPLALAPQILF